MLRALLAHRRLAAGLFLAAVVAAAIPFQILSANDTRQPAFGWMQWAAVADPVTTSAITPAAVTSPDALLTPLPPRPEVVPVLEPVGSPEFLAALEMLDGGDKAQAFALAAALPDAVERRTIEWAAIYFGGGAVDHASVAGFMADAPDFVHDTVFPTRLEQAILRDDVPGTEVIALLGGAMPLTIEAQLALAEAYVAEGQTERAGGIVKAIWTGEFLDADSERRVLDRLGNLLTREDHWARAVHLMMHDRAAASERLEKFLSDEQKSLVVARAAVSRKESGAKALLDKVDAAYQDHPVYIFSRVQRARQAGLYESAVEWLDKAQGALPDSAEWWYERRALVRKLLEVGNAELAYEAAAGYREGPEGRLVEAHFHAGWIALSFLGDAATARGHFEAMQSQSTLADSVTQANFWLGRALVKLGEVEDARAAFEAAAAFPTVYYGQLARAELGLPGVGLRELPDTTEAKAAFDARDIIRAVRLLSANGKRGMAVPLLRSFAPKLETGPELLLAAELAEELDAHNLAIWIADTAEKRGIPLDVFSFPRGGLPEDVQLADVDAAAVYAITRQESHFQADAVSSAGARGLMQLMPETARETAEKVGIAYSKARLTSDPAYNALLGSTYLAAQLSRYGGSLVLAAAAYNAGAGNANDWIMAYGDPREDNVDPVTWVELIPFQETRKYVQRVLGNYLVYRAQLDDDLLSITEALRRIPG